MYDILILKSQIQFLINVGFITDENIMRYEPKK